MEKKMLIGLWLIILITLAFILGLMFLKKKAGSPWIKLTSDKKCAFCRILKEKKEVMYENKYFFAFFDIHPVSPGHVVLSTKRHVTSIFEMKAIEWMYLPTALHDLKKKIETTDFKKLYEKAPRETSERFFEKMKTHVGLNKKIEGYNIGINEGRAAGETIDHVGIHIIPRYAGDVKDSMSGIRHIIPGMGDYK